ncbi:MAG: hypothetical protein PHQ00_06735, partial [Phycisphaerae bacterium]|nr:hypothetical protein [Phycisphaerae bacterium]
MNIPKTSLILMLIIIFTSICAAGAPEFGCKLIDFESFDDYQNIQGLNLGGVTLTNPTSGNVEIYANDRVGGYYHSPVNSIGSKRFDEDDHRLITVNPTVGVFDWPMRYIGLWAGDGGGDMDSWELEAFDAPAGGNSLG